MKRYAIRDKILALDPDNDALEIVQLSVFYDFSWDFNRSLELALYKTFAVPSIAKILNGTKEFEHRTEKRYDDTDLLLSEIIEHGYDSPRGTAAIEHLNWIHSHYNISNEDYLYVLSTFIYEPSRWVKKYGWRQLTRNEELAGFRVWVEIGKRMGIQNIPESIEEFEAFNIEFERKHFIYSEPNRKVAHATENLMLGWFLPKFLWNTGRPFLHGIMDENLLLAFGYNTPPKMIQKIANSALRLRAGILKWLPASNTPFLRTLKKGKNTYPKGYELRDIGPGKLNKKTCPYHAVKELLGDHGRQSTVHSQNAIFNPPGALEYLI